MTLSLKLIAPLAVVALCGLAAVASPASTQGACNEAVSSGNRMTSGSTATYEMEFCSDPTDSLVGRVTWGKKINPDLDMAVVITSPSGHDYVFENGPSATQTFTLYGPLEEGTWTIVVLNTGSRAVNYEIEAAFG